MKIFMSWSGERSKAIAEEFKSFLSKVLQQTQPFISSQDIELGSLGQNRVMQEVTERRFGLIFITPENKKSEWIHYEAGGLIKDLEKDRVVPILFGIEKKEISKPLSQFQMIEFNKKSVLDLIKQINLLTEKPLDPESLNEVFDAFFVRSQDKINSVISDSPKVIETRSTEDILNELLLFTREQSNFNSNLLRSLINVEISKQISDKVRVRRNRYRPGSVNTKILNAVQIINTMIEMDQQRDEIEKYLNSIDDIYVKDMVFKWYTKKHLNLGSGGI